jgi:hypothetical protein
MAKTGLPMLLERLPMQKLTSERVNWACGLLIS